MRGLAHLAAVLRLCPAFRPVGPPIVTETSLLQPGDVDGLPVIAKHPTDRRPFWISRCRNEIRAYQAVAASAPPVLTPALVAADPDPPLLIITRLPGRPLHADRYPTGPVAAATVDRYLDALDELHRWQPDPPDIVPYDGDYPGQLAALCDGLLSTDDLEHLTTLYRIWISEHEVSHGDAHLGNTIDTPTGLALIDLEFLAWRPPGYDAAKLWVFLGETAHLRSRVAARIPADPASAAAFWIGVTLVAAREIISHRRHRHLPHRHDRLDRLAADLDHAIHQAHAIPTEQTSGAHRCAYPPR